jgi:hypothetical protein
MMGGANTPVDVRGKVGIECVKMATAVDGLRVITLNGKTMTRDMHFYGRNPRWATQMRTWGEAGVVKEGKDGKFGDRGTVMMFVGYPFNREADCVRMWNESTNRVVETRDVIWLKRMYFKPAQAVVDFIDMVPEDEEKVYQGEEATNDDASDSEEEEDTKLPAEEAQSEKRVSFREPVAGEATEPDATVLRTRVGRVSRAPERYIETMAVSSNSNEVSDAQLRYLLELAELDNEECHNLIETALVGAGVGGGFDHTDELRVMNYREAMKSPDADEWKEEIKNEFERFQKYNVFTPVKKSDLPDDAKVLTTTWAMKKKTNGTLRGRLNARGYEQLEGKHYFSDSIAAPVSNPTTIRTMLTMLASHPEWKARVIDVEGAFLQGQFEDGEVIYCEVPDGMETFYGSRKDIVLLMNVPLYGTKQAASCFYKTLRKKAREKHYERSKADPCLYFLWREGRLVVFASWVDDLFACGVTVDLDYFEKDIKDAFTCKVQEEFNEYVGNKITVTRDTNGIGTIKFTQPVLIQKLKDQFELPNRKAPSVPAVAGQELVRGDGSDALSLTEATKYRSGTAINMYVMQWSRPDIYNASRGLARQMSAPRVPHMKALTHLIHYVTSTPERGLVLKPNRVWNGDKDFEWVIGGRSDSNYASNVDDRRSVTGGRVLLNGSPVTFRSATQRFVTLSVTEAEGAAGVTIAQDMIYVYRVLDSLGLKVKTPMILEMDNKGAVDLANNWSVGGRTRHVDVRMHYMRELKDQGLLVIKHIPGEDNDADIFTKNTAASVFNKHIPVYVGVDEYMEESQGQSKSRDGEAVRE